MEITYKVESGQCKTPCPYRRSVIYIGSLSCWECEHFISLGVNNQSIVCAKYESFFTINIPNENYNENNDNLSNNLL